MPDQEMWIRFYIKTFPYFQKWAKPRNVDTSLYRDVATFSEDGHISSICIQCFLILSICISYVTELLKT